MFPIKEVMTRLGLEEDEVLEFLDDFLTYSLEDLAEMRKGLATRDHEGIARRAHSIKGASSNLSLESVSSLAAAIEKMARSGDLHSAEELVETLESHFDEIAAYLADKHGS